MKLCEYCNASLEGRTKRARFCDAECRQAAWLVRRSHKGEFPSSTQPDASERLPDGRWRTQIGPVLTVTVPGDWPDISARFWEGVRHITYEGRTR